ncbi:MAG: hypothetical protein AUK55_10585 [Syntrophobacteraceae bacterium CG2_30_61_12]|nr:MAG: hypothetical protein AUK55_10585 [Syntrophobacteraceae bacterium CG2_30_61_12]
MRRIAAQPRHELDGAATYSCGDLSCKMKLCASLAPPVMPAVGRHIIQDTLNTDLVNGIFQGRRKILYS